MRSQREAPEHRARRFTQAAKLPDWRCPDCQRLLIRAELKPGSRVEAYCKHCHKTMLIVMPVGAVW